jgi:hypothetical protein
VCPICILRLRSLQGRAPHSYLVAVSKLILKRAGLETEPWRNLQIQHVLHPVPPRRWVRSVLDVFHLAYLEDARSIHQVRTELQQKGQDVGLAQGIIREEGWSALGRLRLFDLGTLHHVVAW